MKGTFQKSWGHIAKVIQTSSVMVWKGLGKGVVLEQLSRITKGALV